MRPRPAFSSPRVQKPEAIAPPRSVFSAKRPDAAVSPATARPGKAGTSSTAAYANLSGGGSSCLAPNPFSFLSLPDKGLRVFANASKFKMKQDVGDLGMSHYDHKGDRYSFGFLHDWSIDSSIGLSVDIIDSKIKSRHPLYKVKNDIDAYVFHADYDGLLLGKFPMAGSLFYGRVENKGDGVIHDVGLGVPTPTAWREDKHKSSLHGVSWKIGAPMIYGDDFKFMPEIGIRYVKLKSKAYDVNVEGAAQAFRMPSHDSSSLSIPLTVTLRRDFLQCWGLVTPRLGAGLIAELDDKALALRGLNSSAASRIFYDAPTSTASTPVYDEGQRWLYQVGAGVDIKTVGGWEIAADYQRYWSSGYSNDVFKLELGRCF